MEYGGWYDNPATGRNQRWFDGVWTDGEEPSQASAGGQGWDAAAIEKSTYENLEKEINASIGEILKQNQGDYDFAAKWIEKNYIEATGSNDTMRAEIIKKVANNLEKEVGRIGYDYETGKYRIEQNKSIALERLKLDEQQLTKQHFENLKQDQSRQNTSLNARGLMEGGNRQTVGGLAGENISTLENTYADKLSALRRSITEGEQDINLSASRNIEDLGTTARRGYEDQGNSRDYNTESAKRQLDASQLAAENKKKEWLRGATSTAAWAGYTNNGRYAS
jgi:hypothetical protein